MGNISRLHYGNKYAHSRKGQGAGVPRYWQETRKHPSRFCPLCTGRFTEDDPPIPFLLDKRTAKIPRWIPARLDGQVVTLCGDCRSVLLTGRYHHGGHEEIVHSNGAYAGGERPAIGQKRCKDCGEIIRYRSTRCNDCSNARKGKARRKHLRGNVEVLDEVTA